MLLGVVVVVRCDPVSSGGRLGPDTLGVATLLDCMHPRVAVTCSSKPALVFKRPALVAVDLSASKTGLRTTCRTEVLCGRLSCPGLLLMT